ncbi:MAG: response regulator transcription factor [Hyphomicrobium sp.]
MNRSEPTRVPKLLIVDDHPVVLFACRRLFESSAGFNVIEARSSRSGLEAFSKECPDITVLDINLPDGSGLQLARFILNADQAGKIVMFTMSESPMLAVQAIDIGVRGFVSKLDEPERLLAAVLAVLDGKQWITDRILQDVALLRAGSPASATLLNEKEINIIRAMVSGRSLAEIATEHNMSYKTAATYSAALRRKLNARTNSELARIAIELGIS